MNSESSARTDGKPPAQRSVYEEQARVPLVVAGPKVLAGARQSAVVQTILTN